LQQRIVFRTDASVQIGTGHVMRCLTLADALRDRGAECLFISRPHQGHLLDTIAERGHQVMALPTRENLADYPADFAHAHWLGTDQATDSADTLLVMNGTTVDWLVVDHYALDHRWEQALRPHCRQLMVMDDLADRSHDCDLLLDPSLGRTPADYAHLTPPTATLLLGPQYALLRPEFARLRDESLARRASPRLEHLLITMGGVDKDNATGAVLDALDSCTLPPDLRITVVMGQHAPWLAQVKERAARMNRPVQVLAGVRDMARLMANSDLAIGAAGGTSWERCCLGLPAIQLVLADNQREAAVAFSALGAAESLAVQSDLSQTLPPLLHALQPDRLRALSDSAAHICDGRGTPKAVELLLRKEQ